MREILFRGKRVDNGEWVYGYFVKKLDPLLLTEMCFILVQEYDTSCIDGTPTVLKSEMTWYRVIPSTIGQYTGLTDKNGTKIFEGDIIQDYIEPKPKGIIRFGEYETPYKEWTQISTDTHLKHIGFFIEWRNGVFRKDLQFWNEKIDVIGNIHDNPELLKECEGGNEAQI